MMASCTKFHTDSVTKIDSFFETTDERLTFIVTIPVRELCEESSGTKNLIIDITKRNPHITAAEITMQLNISSRVVEKHIRKLRELGKIGRKGGRFGCYWEILAKDNC